MQEQLKDVNQIQSSLPLGGLWLATYAYSHLRHAFAALKSDGSVVTWGRIGDGGDSKGMGGQLKDVRQIQSSSRAFAAITNDGGVVAWGDSPRHS